MFILIALSFALSACAGMATITTPKGTKTVEIGKVTKVGAFSDGQLFLGCDQAPFSDKLTMLVRWEKWFDFTYKGVDYKILMHGNPAENKKNIVIHDVNGNRLFSTTYNSINGKYDPTGEFGNLLIAFKNNSWMKLAAKVVDQAWTSERGKYSCSAK
jgi:hypothetical protein